MFEVTRLAYIAAPFFRWEGRLSRISIRSEEPLYTFDLDADKCCSFLDWYTFGHLVTSIISTRLKTGTCRSVSQPQRYQIPCTW